MSTTKSEVKAALDIVRAVADTIQELGSTPSGVLYAQLVGSMSLGQYNQILGILKRSQLVTESPSHLLTWKGGKYL